MRIVVGLGGRALTGHAAAGARTERHYLRLAAEALAPLTAAHELIVCHAGRLEPDWLDPGTRLDVAAAQAEGLIGYWLAQDLRNAGVGRTVASLITQVIVDAADPAFETPTRFFGPRYGKDEARRLADEHGWIIARDALHWRRVVPAPQPQRIVERAALHQLITLGTVVVCGAGIPVIEEDSGELAGAEAVIDADLTAAALAVDFVADQLLLLTDVPAVMRDYGTPDAKPIPWLSLDELEALNLPAGNMGRKLDACGWFTRATGNPSAIGAVRLAPAILAGTAGTIISDAARLGPRH